MKKVTFLLFALVLSFGTIQANAFQIPAGEWNAHFSDFSAIYHNGVAQAANYAPVQGDYLKAVINLDQVIPKGGGLAVWNPSTTEQVAGFEYGFQFNGSITAGTTFTSFWAPLTVAQSRVDLYQRNPYVWNTAAGFAPRTGPDAVDSGANDNNPNIAGAIAGINDAGATLLLGLNVLTHPGVAPPGTTLILTSNVGDLGTGSGDFYADVDSGSFAGSIEHQLLGPAQIPADFYLKFSYNINNPLYGWTVRSEDPAEFSIVPEPGTLLLVGSGLLGLGFFARRRKA